MKNLFLYYNSNSKQCEKLNNLKDIYLFKSKKIVAIDKNTYDKEQRLELQKMLYIQPYYMTQRIFKELLISIVNNSEKFRIIDILFDDDTLDEQEEYLCLIEYIRYNKKDLILNQIELILDEYNTDISSITFVFEDKKFKLTDTGILETEDSDRTLFNFLNDKNLNANLLGLT